MPLTDSAIRNAKPGIKPTGEATRNPYKLADSGGMYLEVYPNGSKYWRLKYRYAGKEKRLALGVYPDVTLKGKHVAAATLRASCWRMARTPAKPSKPRSVKGSYPPPAALRAWRASGTASRCIRGSRPTLPTCCGDWRVMLSP